MYHLYKIDHLRDYGTVDDVVKTSYSWIEDKDFKDFAEWCADGMTYTKLICTVLDLSDIEAIFDACEYAKMGGGWL
jgi:hypothetical protein